VVHMACVMTWHPIMVRCTIIDPNAMTRILMWYRDPKANVVDPNVCGYGHRRVHGSQ
jgi:hypothetical protein